MVHPSVLMSLAQLIYHRRFDLPNGNCLIGKKEFDTILERDGVDEATLNQRGVFQIPESFRVLFVGESQSKEHKWINENVLSMVPFYTVPDLLLKEQAKIISQITKESNPDSVNKLIEFVEKIKSSHDSGLRNTAQSLSLRRLIHIAKRDLMQPGHLQELVEKAALSKFLPQLTKEIFEKELKAAGIINDTSIRTKENEKYLEMIRVETERPEDEALIPNVLFHHNEQHDEILEDMARDMKLGSHLLLIGNQGVGKNKLTDRFLHLINRPRQYMQLHRDTTVQTLTMQTVVENGIIRHEDSALVKAARNGQILVIDEADKAPLHVIAILKSLLDTGNLVLGDGRSLRPAVSFTEADKQNDRLVPIHPNFRIIMLANRPGFPFLGNNLFAVLGDLFAIHMIDHPGRASELEMIRKYGPEVPVSTLNNLLNIFNELRQKTDEGILQYPYSTRELVNIVRHCNEFPDDPLPEVCRNVFDFDSFSEDTISIIQEVFRKHGIPLGVNHSNGSVSLTERISLGEAKPLGRWSRQNFNFPQSYGFETPLPVEIEMPIKLDSKTYKLDRKNDRHQVFSEQQCVWQFPSEHFLGACDGIRVNDDFVAVTMLQKCLIHCKDFMNADSFDRLNIHKINSNYFPKFRLAYLGGDNVLVHDQVKNFTSIISLPDQMGASVKQNTSLTEKFGAMVTGTNYPWRLSNQKSNHALLYEYEGQEILVYTDEKHGVTVQKGTFPFKIKRVFAHAPQQWTVVSTDNSNYFLTLENGKWELEQVENNFKGGIDAIATQIREQGMTMVADPYYYIQGLDPGDVTGIQRKEFDKYVSARHHLCDDKFLTTFDPARDVQFLGNTIVRAIPNFQTPKDYVDEKVKPYDCLGFLEAVDTDRRKICYVPVPNEGATSEYRNWTQGIAKTSFQLVPWDDKTVLTMDPHGKIRSFELQLSSLSESFEDWKRMTGGNDDGNLRLEFDRSPDDVDFDKLDEPKLGKFDPNNMPHHGGNQWMGGTGGYNTAGLGGIGGPFRLDAGHDVHQMPDFAKQKVPQHILKKARDIAKVEYEKKLREINMSEHDADAYDKVWKKVQLPAKKLAAVIDQLEAKKKEREWTKHQTSGDLDDGKLIERVTGEQNIYRRRVDKEPDPGAPQTKPKRLRLCMDVSGSMYRFNGFDNRLVKTMEATLMTMNALDGKTDKIKYDIIGHSGDSHNVPFVKADYPPRNDKERLDVMKRMIAHTQYCASGDSTVFCLQYSVNELGAKKDDFDETVVVLVSDANLARYGIRPDSIKSAMLKNPNVNTFVVLIGNLSREAEFIQKQLPSGKAFVLENTDELPKIMETIFSSTIAQ
uniref:VWFA domain-containing protein n=2 Tax=Caenorhabditis tropicalis TaxID=1561998 RepID=A0A1I7USB8_9PELO